MGNPMKKVSGLTLGVVANIIWGTSFMASKVTLSHWGPFTSSFLRFLLATIGFTLVFPILGQKITLPKNKMAWILIFLVAATGFGFLYPLQLAGMKLIATSLSASIMLTSPLFVIILWALIAREKLAFEKLFTIFLGGIGGIILLKPETSGLEQASLIGILLTLGAAVSLALSIVITRKLKDVIEAKSLTFWSMAVGTLMFLPFSINEAAVDSSSFWISIFATGSLEGFLALAYLSFICSILAFVLWNVAIHQSGPEQLASSMHIKTPVAVVLGIYLKGEPMTWNLIIGTLLVSLAIYLGQLPAYKSWMEKIRLSLSKYVSKKLNINNGRVL